MTDNKKVEVNILQTLILDYDYDINFNLCLTNKFLYNVGFDKLKYEKEIQRLSKIFWRHLNWGRVLFRMYRKIVYIIVKNLITTYDEDYDFENSGFRICDINYMTCLMNYHFEQSIVIFNPELDELEEEELNLTEFIENVKKYVDVWRFGRYGGFGGLDGLGVWMV